MATRKPAFLKTAEQLDKWLERFNPLQGATLGTLSGYFAEADEGRFANVMWMARKMIRRDPTIRACMRRIYSQLMKLDWDVKIMEELPAGITKSKAQRQADFLKGKYEQIENLKQAAAFSAMADFYGFAHLEKHYDQAGDVARLQPVPQWHWVRAGFYGDWKFNPSAQPWARNAESIEPGDFVVREIDDPWIEIALIHGLRINQNDRDWDGYAARYGIPSTFFIAPPGANDDKLDEFEDIANDLAADGAGVLPNGSEVKTHESSSKGEVFGTKAKHHQSAIVLAATGGLLTMLAESGSGTLAGGAHSDTWRDLVAGIASEVSECFQEQLDKVWLAEAFPGQKIAVYFKMEFPEEETDVKALVESVKGLKDAGFQVKREWVEEETGMPLEEVAPSTPPAPGDPSPLNNRVVKRRPWLGEVILQELRNREPSFSGGPSSARDRAEALQLAEAAIQDALDVTRETVAPLVPDLQALIDLAQNGKASADDFIALAAKVEQLLPELMTPDSVKSLATSLEAALGTAAAMGARATLRRRKQ